MIKSVTILKQRGGRQGPSARTLRRAMRPARGRIGLWAVLFLVLLSLVVGAVGISLNLNLERWEHEHSMAQHGK